MTFLLKLYLKATSVLAQTNIPVFDGGGLGAGIGEATAIRGPVHTSLRLFILIVLAKVLFFLALIAIVMIVIAGLYLMFSQGNDEQKNKAKNIIIYVCVGLIVILLARLIVGFVITIV